MEVGSVPDQGGANIVCQRAEELVDDRRVEHGRENGLGLTGLRAGGPDEPDDGRQNLPASAGFDRLSQIRVDQPQPSAPKPTVRPAASEIRNSKALQLLCSSRILERLSFLTTRAEFSIDNCGDFAASVLCPAPTIVARGDRKLFPQAVFKIFGERF